MFVIALIVEDKINFHDCRISHAMIVEARVHVQ